ncbi:MAG: diacylglycerol kinase family lipid kinase [Deltaproteobacteria bacterium]|nr:diacylglycerol kinase family lipid kinase [Deltaproteobacteria bacterium]
MKALFIINPVAGGASSVKRIREAVVEAFKSEDGIFEIKVAGAKGDTFKLSSGAVKRGYEAVIACGGDGTVHEAAAPLVNTDTMLGVIPCGSGNGFAKSLGIPFDIAAGMELIKKWKPRPIDAGVIGDRYFFSTAGMGFDAHLSKKYNDGFLSKRLRGLLPYFPLAVWEFYRFKPRPLRMKMDNNLLSETPFILTFANIERYGGQAVIAPGAVPDDGFLDVCTVPEIGLLDALDLVKKLFNGRITAFKGYRCMRSSNIDIAGEGISAVHADGEPFQWQGNISVKVLPKGLRVLTG